LAVRSLVNIESIFKKRYFSSIKQHSEQIKNAYKTELSDAATAKILQLQSEIKNIENQDLAVEKENKELKIASMEGIDITKVYYFIINL
jgi:hypothetical protein